MADREPSNATISQLHQSEGEARRVADRLRRHGGGGTFDGMEPRVARLEADMEHVKKTLERLDRGQDGLRGSAATLTADMARLTERVAHLPGKGFVVTATTATIALIGAIVLFADKLRALVAG